MIYHVTCNTDDNYLQHCCAMLCSLFENNRHMTFHVHLLTHGLVQENISFLNELCHRYNNEFTIYDVDESKLEGVKFREKRPLSKAAYYRILLPEILSEEIDKVLYLDCDIIVLGNVKELYDLELSNLALAACQDASPYTNLHRRQLGLDLKGKAFCSGLMVINLDYWRITGAEEKLIEYSKREREMVYLHDQDSLNYVFKNYWYALPYKWGISPLSTAVLDKSQKRFDYFEYIFKPGAIHYASPAKPWLDVWTPHRKFYLKYLYLSGFKRIEMSHVGISFRFHTWINNLKYVLNRYIHPLVPNILEIVFVDITNILKIIFTLLFSPKDFKKLMLNLWLKKYQ